MEVVIRGRRYDVTWTHFNAPSKSKFRVAPDESVRQARRGSLYYKRIITECRVDVAKIRRGPKSKPATLMGLAILHPKDLAIGAFDAEKGRKISLANALKVLRLPKRSRGQMWAAYFGKR